MADIIESYWLAYVCIMLLILIFLTDRSLERKRSLRDAILIWACVMTTPVLLTVILSNTGPIFKDLFEYRVLPRAAVALLILPFLSVSGSILLYRGKKISLRAHLCAEEILLNVVNHGLSHDSGRYIDVLVRIYNGNVKMTIRDDGEIFDPITYDSKGTGLMIVMGQCDSLNYARSVNQNNVFIGFDASKS